MSVNSLLAFSIDMSELNFFATTKDHENLVSLLTGQYKAQFVLDAVETPNPPVFSNIDEVMNVINSAEHDPRFYVISPLWTIEPLSMAYIPHDDGRVRYHVRQRIGGPAFDYLARRIRSSFTGEEIVSSWFSDYSYYWSSRDSHEKIIRPLPMMAAYKDIHRLLSHYGTRTDVVETQKPDPFVLKDAISAYTNGAWLRVGDWHHVPRQKANKRFKGANDSGLRQPSL